jgi:hypothetical protein
MVRIRGMEPNPYEAPKTAIEAHQRQPVRAKFHWPTFFIVAAVVGTTSAVLYTVLFVFAMGQLRLRNS